MHEGIHPQRLSVHTVALPQQILQDLLHLGAAFVLIAIAILCSIISLPFGVTLGFFATIVFALVHPTGLPTMVTASFLYQNTVIAIFAPLVGSNDAFDMLRGTNFVLLVAATAICVLAAVVHTGRLSPEARRWLLASIALITLVTMYLVLGAVRGNPRDAIVYFRNIVTPVACFLIGFLISTFYRTEMRRPIIALGSGAILYGYCELLYGMEFLSLFHGDEYIQRRIVRQIETGHWERILHETGFVLRNLEDVMMTPLFNIPGIGDMLPKVFRLSGPNFHPISFAYALSIISMWQVFRNRWLFVFLAFPVLLVVGSKGALIALVAAVALKIALMMLPSRGAIAALLAGALLYIGAAIVYGRSVGDYHVLGLLAGIRDFTHNPLGVGLGFGGNLSGSIEDKVDWVRWQAQGIADIPLESAIGVMMYQMGIAAFAFLIFLALLARKCLSLYYMTGDPDGLFAFHVIVMITINAILQEEAFFSPLALGFALLLVGSWFGRTLSLTTPRPQAAGHDS